MQISTEDREVAGARSTGLGAHVVASLLFILIGLLFGYVAAFALWPKAQALKTNGVVTTATVTGTRWVNDTVPASRTRNSDHKASVVEFSTATGERFIVNHSHALPVGSTVELRYDPADPSGNHVIGDGDPEMGPKIFAGVGVLFILWGIGALTFGVARLKRRAGVLSHGYQVEGQVLRVLSSKFNRGAFDVVARWKHPLTGMEHESQSGSKDRRWRSATGGTQFSGGTVRLYVDREDPSLVVFDLETLTPPSSARSERFDQAGEDRSRK